MPSGPSISLEPGQIILLPTDGIYEAFSTDGGFFGKDRMINAVRANRHGLASDVIEGLRAAVLDHLAGALPRDDLTAVAIKVVGG
jgi:serine phosphatase RsbU (regulator of sigma subunit)